MKDNVTLAWKEYEEGQTYKNRIALYKTVDENIRFNEGDQWAGILAPSLPTPVFNVIKPTRKYMVAQVKDKHVTLKYSADNMIGDDKNKYTAALGQLNYYAKRTWNRLNLDLKNQDGLSDAFITGDYILYHWWNDEIETGQPFRGDLDNMRIDNVNYYPGNPNDPDVQRQPYIIIAMRDMVANVRKMAEKNKIPKENIRRIVPDADTEFTSGDFGKVELDGGEKCNVLLRMWKEKGEVWFAKYTKYAEILKPGKADLKLYPVCMMNWEPRKNCCHGVAEVTYMKPNQVFINKIMAFTQLYLLQTSYPKVIYNKAVISEWTNKVAAAIGVNGNVNDVARYMQPPVMPGSVWKGFSDTIQQTKDLAGVYDAALGNINNPENTSAIIAVRQAAAVPLQLQQERFHQIMRDMGAIWLDFWLSKYPASRMVPNEDNGQSVLTPFEAALNRDMIYDVDVDVGESVLWSELATVQTLDKLMQQGMIKKSQYYKRMPPGYLPDKEELIKDALEEEQPKEPEMPQGQGMPAEGDMGMALQGSGMSMQDLSGALQGMAPGGGIPPMGGAPMDMGMAMGG